MINVRPGRSVDTPGSATGQTFEEFFEAERRRLFRALVVMTGNAAEAEELTQDAFLKVWERWDRVSEMDDPVGYLFRVGLNGTRRRYRRLLLSTRHVLASSDEPNDPYPAADVRDTVVRAVRMLPRRQREALVLVSLLDLSSERAGELMGVSAATVRNQVARAQAAMRREMGPGDDDE